MLLRKILLGIPGGCRLCPGEKLLLVLLLINLLLGLLLGLLSGQKKIKNNNKKDFNNFDVNKILLRQKINNESFK